MSPERLKFSTRRATPSDARALHELQRLIYDEERWFVGDGPPSESVLAARIRALDANMSLWLVASQRQARDELCAWLELHRLPSTRLRHVANLTLAVSPRWRRHGLGRGLLASGFDWAATVGVRKVSLNVRANNEAAIELYRSEGFVLEGRERRQIRTEEGFEDNLIMARFLESELN
ncbi:MAG TPA: GNAT family N-acetyltransferase [Trueperaceae bacterium]